MITKEMLVSWKNDPVTQEVISVIRDYREQAKEYLAHGVENHTEYVGMCKAYAQMLEITLDLDVAEVPEEEV